MIKLSYNVEEEWHTDSDPSNGEVVLARLVDGTTVLAKQYFGEWEDIVNKCGYEHEDIEAWAYIGDSEDEPIKDNNPPNIIDYITISKENNNA